MGTTGGSAGGGGGVETAGDGDATGIDSAGWAGAVSAGVSVAREGAVKAEAVNDTTIDTGCSGASNSRRVISGERK